MKAKHTRINAFTCEKCDFESSYRSVVKRHLRTQHCKAEGEADELKARANDRNKQTKKNKKNKTFAPAEADFTSDEEALARQEISFDEGGDSSEHEEASDCEDWLEEDVRPWKRSRYKLGEADALSTGNSSYKKDNFGERKALNQVDSAEEVQTRKLSHYKPKVDVKVAQSNIPSSLIQRESERKSIEALQRLHVPGKDDSVNLCKWDVDHHCNSRRTAPSIAMATEFNESGFRAITCSAGHSLNEDH